MLWDIYINLQIKNRPVIWIMLSLLNSSTTISAILLTIKNPYDTYKNVHFTNDMETTLFTLI